MNFFFSRKVSVQENTADPDNASAVTAADIKRALREIIDAEDKKKPYSDRLLGEKLAERGISIYRRTVAKYREEEGIADASGRKEYVWQACMAAGKTITSPWFLTVSRQSG